MAVLMGAIIYAAPITFPNEAGVDLTGFLILLLFGWFIFISKITTGTINSQDAAA